jgi:hypothetical protein
MGHYTSWPLQFDINIRLLMRAMDVSEKSMTLEFVDFRGK